MLFFGITLPLKAHGMNEKQHRPHVIKEVQVSFFIFILETDLTDTFSNSFRSFPQVSAEEKIKKKKKKLSDEAVKICFSLVCCHVALCSVICMCCQGSHEEANAVCHL